MTQSRQPNSDTLLQPTRLPASIWALGFVSLLMDVSSEMIHGLLPVYLMSVLGASATMVGIIEGVGEATASLVRLFSGRVSDRMRRRKPLTVLGYGLGALSKPFFALAPTAGWVLVARFSDRVGKGIRGAPRDALVGEITPAPLRGAAYGLRQALDTVGAFLGPGLAIVLMAALAGDFRTIFWIATLPAVLSVATLLLGVREPQAASKPVMVAESAHVLRGTRALGARFWGVVGIASILTLARCSEAFLVLRAQEAGLPVVLAPLALVVMNAAYALSAYPFGAISDRIDRRFVVAGGFGLLIVADLLLASGGSLVVVMAGISVWGLHLGATQGLLSAMVMDVAPSDRRGTAFGVFHFVSGVAALIASVMAGWLWSTFGPAATFVGSAAFTTLGVIAQIGPWMPTRREPG